MANIFTDAIPQVSEKMVEKDNLKRIIEYCVADSFGPGTLIYDNNLIGG